jgi:hypothetical protein
MQTFHVIASLSSAAKYQDTAQMVDKEVARNGNNLPESCWYMSYDVTSQGVSGKKTPFQVHYSAQGSRMQV